MDIKKIKEHIKKHESIYLTASFILWFVVLVLLATVGQTPPFKSLALDVGVLQIAWYAIFILSGIGMASIMAFREAKKLDINSNHLSDGILIAVPLSIIGARLYYVIFDPIKGNYQTIGDVFNIAGGGLAIHGAVIITLIFVVIYTRVRKINIWALLDVLAPGLLLGQIIGRWGNFFNQEAHGGLMSDKAYNFLNFVLPKFIMENMYMTENGETGYFHPTFLYEGLWNLAGLIIILIVRRKKVLKLGDLIGYYLIWYGLGRGLLIEPFRTDPLYIGGIRVNILFSLTLFVLGGASFLIVKNILFRELPYYHEYVLENEKKADNLKKQV